MERMIAKYLEYLNIPVSQKYCGKLILSHPDYPSLLSIADTLQRLGINYNIVRLSNDHLADVPFPYLVKPAVGRRNLTSIEKEYDLTQYLESTEQEESVIMQVQPTDTISDEEHNRQRSEERFLKGMAVAGLVAVTGLLVLAVMQTVTWISDLLLFTALAGTVVGYLLIAKDVGVSYKPVEAFCRTGKKNNCDAILNSEAARLIGPVAFSDATVSYFLFQLIVAGFLLPSVSSFLWILAALSALSVPVIGYSLWYQALEAKIWCGLCLIVDGILITQAALFGYLYYKGLGAGYPGYIDLAAVLLLFGIVGTAVLLLKYKIKVANQTEQAEMATNRIKHSPDVFMHLLNREKHVDATPFEREILIGNPDAPVTILMAASLGCGPCKTGFEQAIRLVAAWPGKVNLTIRLRIASGRSNRDMNPGVALLGYWQQHVYRKPDASAHTEKLFRDWYSVMDLEKFMNRYPAVKKVNHETAKILGSRHSKWFEEAEVKGTPTFFVNGRRLPKHYRIEDLMAMVPGLADHVDQQETKQQTLEAEKEFVPIATIRDNRG